MDEEPSRKRLKSSTSPCCDASSSMQKETVSNIVDLPQELLVHIFKNLNVSSISQCASVCRTFYTASNNPKVYSNIVLHHTMPKNFIEALIEKATCAENLTLTYRNLSTEDTVFNQQVILLLQKCTKVLTDIVVTNCRSEKTLKLIFECEGLTKASFKCCKGFATELRFTNLSSLRFEGCDVPSNVMIQILKNNPNLKKITLVNNINLHTNGIARILGDYNLEIEGIHFVEKRRVRARGIEALARCSKLKELLLGGSLFDCDPENSLEHLAAGCPLLERLSIHSWKGLTDDKLRPVLQSCTQLKYLEFRGVDATIKSCREAALSLPLIRHMDFNKCDRIKRTQLLTLQEDFPEINVVVH